MKMGEQQSTPHQQESPRQQNVPQPQTQNSGGLGDLIQNTKSSGLQKDLEVKPKEEKKAPPVNYEEGWVSIGDLTKTKQDA